MDISRAPVGEERLQEIVRAIRAQGDLVETHYLEAKSDVDLGQKLGRAKVAKFILGAANRLPEDAAAAFQGHAVLAIGAEAGAAPGIPKGVEAIDVRNKVQKYLGSTPPSFTVARVPADRPNREVLFVIVDPPKVGDPIYVCRAAFQAGSGDAKHNLDDGLVYVRVDGATRRANSGDMDALMRRASAITDPALDLQIEIQPAIARVTQTHEFRDAYQQVAIDGFRSDPPTFNKNAFLVPSGPSRRASAEEVEEYISEFTSKLTAGWEEAIEYLLGSALEGLRVTVVNHAASYLAKPRIDMTLHHCRGIDWLDPEDADSEKVLPPVREPPSGLFDSRGTIPALGSFRPYLTTYPLKWTNVGGDLQVTVAFDDLRPGVSWSSDGTDLVVVARDPEAQTVRASWVATVEGVGKRYTGELLLPTTLQRTAIDVYRDLFEIEQELPAE